MRRYCLCILHIYLPDRSQWKQYTHYTPGLVKAYDLKQIKDVMPVLAGIFTFI